MGRGAMSTRARRRAADGMGWSCVPRDKGRSPHALGVIHEWATRRVTPCACNCLYRLKGAEPMIIDNLHLLDLRAAFGGARHFRATQIGLSARQ